MCHDVNMIEDLLKLFWTDFFIRSDENLYFAWTAVLFRDLGGVWRRWKPERISSCKICQWSPLHRQMTARGLVDQRMWWDDRGEGRIWRKEWGGIWWDKWNISHLVYETAQWEDLKALLEWRRTDRLWGRSESSVLDEISGWGCYLHEHRCGIDMVSQSLDQFHKCSSLKVKRKNK